MAQAVTAAAKPPRPVGGSRTCVAIAGMVLALAALAALAAAR